MAEYPAVGSREVKRAFRANGWNEHQGRGHTVFSKGRHVLVVDDDVKRFSPKLLGLMRRQSGLNGEEFIRLLRREMER